MASLQNRNGSYKLTFCYRGKRHYLTLGKVSDQEAEAKSSQVDYLLLRIKQKLVRVPAGVEIEDFVLNDGRVPEPHEALSAKLGLGQLVKRYLETHGNGSFEPKIVERHQTRWTGFDDKILSMYSRGM